MIGIYKITSPKNRIYIGQSIDIDRRFRSYQNIKQHKAQIRLHNSFKKYGIDSHLFEIIEECAEEMLNERERHWQEFYNVLSKKGLNCKLTKTSDKSGKHSEETKLKISNSSMGKKLSKQHKINIGIAFKGKKLSKEHVTKIAERNKGKIISEEHKEALRIARRNELVSNIGKKGKDSPFAKRVVDIETGECWDTLTEFCIVNNLSIKNMSRKLNGTRRNNTPFIYY